MFRWMSMFKKNNWPSKKSKVPNSSNFEFHIYLYLPIWSWFDANASKLSLTFLYAIVLFSILNTKFLELYVYVRDSYLARHIKKITLQWNVTTYRYYSYFWDKNWRFQKYRKLELENNSRKNAKNILVFCIFPRVVFSILRY